MKRDQAFDDRSVDIAAFRSAAQRFPEMQSRFALLLYARVDGDATRLRARMFAPLSGILEDPATGSANAALAALLTSLAPGENVDLHYEIEQGVEMGRPSFIHLHMDIEAGAISNARIGGQAVRLATGVLDL